MANITIQKPTDQPTGSFRLIDEIRANLSSTDFDHFWFIVAFAKQGPLLRLDAQIQAWTASGNTLEAIFGIDQAGTSKQALEYALASFSAVHLSHIPQGTYNPTFHPKIYFFKGPEKALGYVGSNNLTVGGTETNAETFVKFELDLPADNQLVLELEDCWNDALRISLPLNQFLLDQLVRSRQVIDEQLMHRLGALRKRSLRKQQGRTTATSQAPPSFPSILIKPPSSLPKLSFQRKKTKYPPQPVGPLPPPAMALPVVQALVIQIVPHNNGEVFLSKTAVNQNPAFFGWPFTGQTTPKFAHNPSYPQRVPDPVVNLNVYDSGGNLVVSYRSYDLNTVYYSKKSEIRITVPQDVVHNAPAYSILVMREAPQNTPRDYDIEIFAPGSTQFGQHLSVCNQKMGSVT